MQAILFTIAAWLSATAFFVGIPAWRAIRAEPERKRALFFPRRGSGTLAALRSQPVWIEWWIPFGGVYGTGRGCVIEVADRKVTIDVAGRSIAFVPHHESRTFTTGRGAATGKAQVGGVEVSAVVVVGTRL
jgi:hypothetical protein